MRTLVLGLVLTLLTPAALAAGICAPSCAVVTNDYSYVTPITVVTTGATITWSSIGLPHTASAPDYCFNVAYSGSAPGSATFRTEAGQLFVKVGNIEKKCAGAAALPDGTTVLPYVCILHQNMRGVIVVASLEVPA